MDPCVLRIFADVGNPHCGVLNCLRVHIPLHSPERTAQRGRSPGLIRFAVWKLQAENVRTNARSTKDHRNFRCGRDLATTAPSGPCPPTWAPYGLRNGWPSAHALRRSIATVPPAQRALPANL